MIRLHRTRHRLTSWLTDPVLLTCEVDNEASARVIERSTGVLEDVRGTTRRCWVPVPSGRGDRPRLAG